MSSVITEIDSKVNELFAKTKVTQKFSNPSENPLELRIFVIKKKDSFFPHLIVKSEILSKSNLK